MRYRQIEATGPTPRVERLTRTAALYACAALEALRSTEPDRIESIRAEILPIFKEAFAVGAHGPFAEGLQDDAAWAKWKALEAAVGGWSAGNRLDCYAIRETIFASLRAWRASPASQKAREFLLASSGCFVADLQPAVRRDDAKPPTFTAPLEYRPLQHCREFWLKEVERAAKRHADEVEAWERRGAGVSEIVTPSPEAARWFVQFQVAEMSWAQIEKNHKAILGVGTVQKAVQVFARRLEIDLRR